MVGHLRRHPLPISVSRAEYVEALSTALDVLNTDLPLSHQSGADQALAAVVAWCWDSTPSSHALDRIGVLDTYSRNLAEVIICGRGRSGRPADHPRRDDIERVHRRYHYGPLKPDGSGLRLAK